MIEQEEETLLCEMRNEIKDSVCKSGGSISL